MASAAPKFDAKMRLEPGGQGWTDLRKRLDSYIANGDRWYARSAFLGMRGVEAQAKALCPVDTGRLRESIEIRMVPGGGGRLSGGFAVGPGGRKAREAEAAAYNRANPNEFRRAATFRTSGGRIGGGARRDRAYKVLMAEFSGQSVTNVDLEIGTDLYYGHFIEFGTKHMPARPFLRPAWDREYRKVIQIMAATELVDYNRSEAADHEMMMRIWPRRRANALVESSGFGQYEINSNTFGSFSLNTA